MRATFFDSFPDSVQIMLGNELFGNTFGDIVWAGVVFITLLLGIYLFRHFVVEWIRRVSLKTVTSVDDYIKKAIDNVSGWFYWYMAFYLTIKVLKLPETLDLIFDVLFLVFVVWQSLKMALLFLEYGLNHTRHAKDSTLLQGMKMALRITFIMLGGILILSNLGVNITALTASLGIGGIAVAFALQNVLGDIFAALSIYFDRPFRIGDTIQLGEDMGVVKRIGLKSTRILTLSGEHLVVANREITESRVRNFRPMQRRRVVFQLGFEYGTDMAVLKKLQVEVAKKIEDMEFVSFGRMHFVSFANSALLFECMYYVEKKDYDVYLNVQQDILFMIQEMCDEYGLSMAFPTQTIHVAMPEKNVL
jgi:small-conductance mechanosensitive channel